MKKLELLKQKLSVETTEQLLDISEQPQEQCQQDFENRIKSLIE